MLPQLAGALTLGIWLYILLPRRIAWRQLPVPSLQKAPVVVAVVPARNEEATVGAALASLARQSYPGEFHIVLVDDHSNDGTPALARAAAPPERLTVVNAAPLPPGWTGKLWAMSEGVRHARRLHPQYFLFTDADITHPPDNLAGLVARAEEGGYALVSYMATLQCRTLAERALIPAFVFFFFLLYPPREGTGAAGGCILLRSDALDKIGGLESIRGDLIDDCALARAVHRHGGRVWLGLGRETHSIRDYQTFAEIGRMISRTAFTQLRYSALLLAGTLAALVLVFVVPPALAIAAPLPARTLGALAWLLMSVAYLPAVRYYRRSPLWAPLLPAIAMFYAACTVHSAVSHWRGAGGLWKGRVQSR